MKKSISLFSLFLVATFLNAQKTSLKQLTNNLDGYLSSQFKPGNPGCAILISQKGKVIYKKAFGSASVELNTAIDPDMVFNLGSVTKQFTAVAILQLMENGKLNLQDSIQQYVKSFPSKGFTIAIENLLTHTSGIKDYLQIDYGQPYMERWDFTPAAIIDSFKNQPLEFEPGTQWKYSNSGYFLLGYIIEKVSGKTWQQYMQENIFAPLSLTHTFTDNPGDIIPNRVYGYKNADGIFKKEDFWSATLPYAAGAIISNVEDLFTWHQALYANKILKKETLAKAFSSFKLKNGLSSGYGYGWFVRDDGTLKSIEHGGNMPGFVSNVIYYPEEDVFIAILFNSSGVPVEDISLKIGELALGKSLQPDIKIEEAILNSYVGTYQLSTDNNRTITIYKNDNKLLAAISGQGTLPILFETNTKFRFKNVPGVTATFVTENGIVKKMVVTQNGVYEWIKIK